MNAETLATIVTAWCTVLTVVGGALSVVFRHWLRSYIEKFNVALKNAEQVSAKQQTEIDTLKTRYTAIKAYASALRDAMVANGLKPEKPPIEFYD